MEFRWVAAITLWTMLSGPVFVCVQGQAPLERSSRNGPQVVKVSKPMPEGTLGR